MNYIDVRDVALIHVAAVLDPEISHGRIYAWAQPFNWSDILAIMWRLYPEKKIVDALPNMGQMIGTVDDSLGLKFMKRWGCQEVWTSLDDCVKENLEDVE